MSSQPIEWDGQVIAILVHGQDGDYLVPPVVRDSEGNILMGHEVLEAIVQSGVAVELPVIENCTVGKLAEIDSRLAQIRDSLGVPFLSL